MTDPYAEHLIDDGARAADPLLERYLERREQIGDGEPEENEELPPGHEMRHCPNCGAWAVHTLDTDGTWYECRECGRLA